MIVAISQRLRGARLLAFSALSLVFALNTTVPALHAQTQLSPGSEHYSIVQSGKTLGDAQYTIETIAGGFSITSTGHMALGKFSYSFHNQSTLDASLNLVRDALSGSVNGAKTHGSNVTFDAASDPSGRELQISISADGKPSANTVDRHRNTVLVPDLDPGAYTLMARIAMADPQSAWALIPKENGLLVPAGYKPQPDVQGTLNGANINVKHITAALSDSNSVTLELYATPDGRLLEADLNAQDLDLVADGFKLLEHPAPTPPPPGQIPANPGQQAAPQTPSQTQPQPSQEQAPAPQGAALNIL